MSENAAIDAAVDSGIVEVVAAGNDGKDACLYSPASASKAITVAAINNINDQVVSYSNYGTCVTLFAPGSGVLSACDTCTEWNLNGLSTCSRICCQHLQLLW